MKKLILIEGIPGSGKSTFARFVSIQFERNGFKSKLFHETTYDHPISLSSKTEDTAIWMETYLNHWRTFLEEKSDDHAVVVMESAFMQTPILNLLHKDIDREEIKSFIVRLSLLLSRIDCSLIFFYQKDAVSAINKMINSRGGNEFLLKKYEKFKNEKFYVNRENKGPELHVAFLQEYADLAFDVSSKVKLESLIIERTQEKWHSYEMKILEFFGLNFMPDPVVSSEQLQRFVGVFRNDTMNLNVQIELKDGSLFIFNHRMLRPRRDHVFYLDDISVEVRFIEKNEEINRLVIGEKDIFVNRSNEGTGFVRVEC